MVTFFTHSPAIACRVRFGCTTCGLSHGQTECASAAPLAGGRGAGGLKLSEDGASLEANLALSTARLCSGGRQSVASWLARAGGGQATPQPQQGQAEPREACAIHDAQHVDFQVLGRP